MLLKLLILIGTAALAFSQDYFPLQVGNQWVYRTTFAGRTSTTVVDVLVTEFVNQQFYSVVRGFEEGQVLLRTDENNTLYRYDPVGKKEEVWAVFSTPEGKTYRTAITECNQTAKVESRNAVVKVPVGEFDWALRISYPVGNCADAGLISDAYLPYIGLIERTSNTIAGPRIMRLIYSRTGGVTVLSEPETSFSLALNNNVFMLGKESPLLTARLTLRNTSAKALELQFTSGQRYDLAIRNEKGEVVYRWSATRLFIAQLGTERIAGGERNWIETIPLGPEGAVLSPGSYSLEAFLTTADQKPRYAATVGFEVLPPTP